MPNFFATAKIHRIRSPVNPHLLGFQLYPLGPVFIFVPEGVGRTDIGSRAAEVEAAHAGTSSAERRVSSNRSAALRPVRRGFPEDAPADGGDEDTHQGADYIEKAVGKIDKGFD